VAIFPVILCGGSGTRLWPASRPARPKQFLDLVGEFSLFQDTVRRVESLAAGGGQLIVVAGKDHEAFVLDQLATIGVKATVLLEPAGRDSAPAMAAAAQVIARGSPDGVALFVASDHHIPDGEAFRAAALEGFEAAQAGRIVTFGVRPTEPSSAYGYICPEHGGLSPVRRFVEKPDRATAQSYLKEGYLWNSGNFMVAASTLLQEMDAYAPDILASVSRALPADPLPEVIRLSEAFIDARKVSIDYAVLERSRHVSVLPVGFSWSDLGAWDAVASTGSGSRGVWVGQDGDSCLVRAAEGMVVATAGVTNLAIIAEHDAVLVCTLDRAQEVKGLVERLAEISPSHIQKGRASEPLVQTARRFERWLSLNALPLWAALGVDGEGGFEEALDLDGRAVGDFRRARVQARQVFVFATAGRQGWNGPWRTLVERGLDRFEQTNRRPDGLYRTRVSRQGEPIDDTASLYDQAFVLFAFAAAARAGVRLEQMTERARGVLTALDALRVEGGWREVGEQPYQANAHMHLLEAFLEWEDMDPTGPWAEKADSIVALARRAFIDPETGCLREFFEADWTPAAGRDGRLVEPGHQFEWAWLLTRWSRLRDGASALETARRLYAVGRRGVDDRRGVAIDELDVDLTVRSNRARLWPQTERLKAALILAEAAKADERADLLDDAAKALKGLQLYLEPSGLWWDKMEADGRFVDEPAPASSFYHIMSAGEQLKATASALLESGRASE
jgi:mannose-1-phosphate guanylyltransferase/mannose-6-phosphate isomerase